MQEIERMAEKMPSLTRKRIRQRNNLKNERRATMKRVKKLLAAVLSMVMLVAMTIPVQASEATDGYIEELLQYYANYQETAQTDIDRILDEIKQEDETLYEEWSQIMDYWSYVNTEMTVYTGVAPDGLPEDDSLCIVVLGFALNPDGTMKDELIGRLTVALASAEKYPNAYVACTGGGTAANNPDATEADQMAEWLIEQGLDPDRVIVENQSKSTVQNAQFTYAILRSEYPQIDSLCMVTSDYHVQRGSLLYYAQCLLSAYEAGDKQLGIVSNAGYVTGSEGYESIGLQANGLAQVAGISANLSVVPELSKLTGITATSPAEYQIGDELNISVTAVYDSGYEKDVTSLCAISGFDSSAEGNQTIKISYTENGITLETSMEVEVKAAKDPTVPGTDEPQGTENDKDDNTGSGKVSSEKSESQKTAVKAPVTGDESAVLPAVLLAAGCLIVCMISKKYKTTV